MRKQILTLAVLALAGVVTLTGCKKKLAETTMPVMTFSATTDSGDDGSKTSLVPSNGAVLWTAGDQINVNGTTMPLSDGANTINGKFTGNPDDSYNYYVAGYPGDKASINSYTSSTTASVTFDLPTEQTLTENGFGNGANPMVAKSNSTALQFRNVCGGLAIRLCAPTGGVNYPNVDYIKVTSKDNKYLSGNYVVDYSGDTPSVTAPTDGTGEIVLSGTPVALSTDENNPTVFYVMLPVNSYPGGFNVVVKSGSTILLDKDFAAVTSIERNRLYLLATTTTNNVAVVTTGTAGSITTNSATVSGNSVAGAGYTIGGRGVCYGTAGNPTVGGAGCNSVEAENGYGSFDANITGLVKNTTYHYRAYAKIGDASYVYGEDKTFTTSSNPAGTIDGVFTINSSGNKVYFSKSNMYATDSDNTNCYFSTNQWDYVATSTTANPHSLFKWSVVANGNDDPKTITIDGVGWRIMTSAEWKYVTGLDGNRRGDVTKDGIFYAKANVAGVNGVILLPDNWDKNHYTLNNTNETGANYTVNTINIETWNSSLAPYGCVFLPAAGFSYGNDGTLGYYWSSTEDYSSTAYSLLFLSSDFYMNIRSDTYGQSVRLVVSAD